MPDHETGNQEKTQLSNWRQGMGKYIGKYIVKGKYIVINKIIIWNFSAPNKYMKCKNPRISQARRELIFKEEKGEEGDSQ